MKKTNVLLSMLVLIFVLYSCSKSEEEPEQETNEPVTETFTFSSIGINQGKIYLPASYQSGGDFPVIYLIDFQEQHFEVAKDEFQQVINAVALISGFDALVVTLSQHHNINAQPEDRTEYYNLFKNMASYVDANYQSNSSRTFIGRGSEGSLVLLSLFEESGESLVFDNFIVTDPPIAHVNRVYSLIVNDNFPKNKQNKRLHYSFSDNYEVEQNTKFINSIKAANYSWLTFGTMEYPNLTYETTYKQSFAAGIKFAFNK